MLEIKVGPPQIAIHDGLAVLVTEPDGQIDWPTDKGLYFRDTRLLSGWYIYANGESWELLNGGSLHHRAARIYLTNKSIPTEQGDIPARTLSLVVSRSIGAGVHEDIDIANHSMKPVRFNLELVLRSDFADIFEVKSNRIIRRGRITTSWDGQTGRLDTTYRNKDFHRELIVQAERSDSPAVYANGRMSFEVVLEAGAEWHACLLYELVDGMRHYAPPDDCTAVASDAHIACPHDEWAPQVLAVDSTNPVFNRLFAQAVDDMSAMRLPIAGDGSSFVPAAGLPWFVALFGRDSLIVSLQNAIVCPDFARGALDALARWQADARDDWRDAEPGKIAHELRLGELAHFKLIPHTPYYGTADATPLYPIVLHSAWRATGDRALLDRHLGAAERCLAWIDEYGDRDGDGFQEYQTRSPVGYENQGWKDAGEAVVDVEGYPVRGPKALCELQGYVYDAWQRMAEIYDALGNADRATALRQKAAALFKRFNEVFWDEASGFYAFCLDGEKRPILSVASNPGHCLWSGIVPPDRAARVVERLMRPDMWSGWGIRTLSADNPSFNPYSYQNGSVWPHDNGIIALGFRRYGFAREAAAIAHDVVRAASFFMLNQLPELYSGIERDGTNFPVQYLGANVPQAWAAGSVFTLLQAILGLQLDAPRQRLMVDPALPEWLLGVTLRGLRVGEARLDLRFVREEGATRVEVLDGDASLLARPEPGAPGA
ncbi:MAG TPA: glycogen debranching N-terminal domain-containing protein [Acetobacteraceae bacterium]|nr:glycogen debranching N-terminal domain-containing protein [Acetobacteraceae bacterium]